MSVLSYIVSYSIAGKLLLRARRLRDSRSLSRARWDTSLIAPPLKISAWTKELISRHYLKGRYVEGIKPVAWVTSGAPVEFLTALGLCVLYPENHAALCGTRRVVEELSEAAESKGYSRDLCSYARADIGALLTGKTPVGKLPRPDLLVACTNICQTVLYWYRVLAEHFRVPLVVIDTPFIYEEATPQAVEYVKIQIEQAITTAEKVAGRKLSWSRLTRTLELSREAVVLWGEVLSRGRHVPSPISVFDQFIHMAPVVEMRGEEETVRFYRALLDEVEQRIRKGMSAVRNEKKRVLWDNLPIWYRLRALAERLAARGIAIVASTYTNAWAQLSDLMDPSRPVESMARVYLSPILNRGAGYKLSLMKEMVREYSLNGVILHSDRSCKPYSIGQVDQRKLLTRELGVPALLLEADHADPRSFSEEQVFSRLDSFAEMLGA
ncbi:MAG: 2-hydroxyacyl-CoA dehydratase [Deltaproteobacteria bacterium]|nr:MAG: 2-hydroxyacyl-CoA dehydratase [Deltaproteobacteria bacterium]